MRGANVRQKTGWWQAVLCLPGNAREEREIAAQSDRVRGTGLHLHPVQIRADLLRGALRRRGILLDGLTQRGDARLLLQIFSQTLLGPVFFEFIQRKGDDGFGEGNFKALFESMERDQLRRGVLGTA